LNAFRLFFLLWNPCPQWSTRTRFSATRISLVLKAVLSIGEVAEPVFRLIHPMRLSYKDVWWGPLDSFISCRLPCSHQSTRHFPCFKLTNSPPPPLFFLFRFQPLAPLLFFIPCIYLFPNPPPPLLLELLSLDTSKVCSGMTPPRWIPPVKPTRFFHGNQFLVPHVIPSFTPLNKPSDNHSTRQ